MLGNHRWTMGMICFVMLVACNRVKKIDSADSSDTDSPQLPDMGGTDAAKSTDDVIQVGTKAIGSCMVDWETTEVDFEWSQSDGVDILVVVDNTGSMVAEQEILATSIYSLLNSLENPVWGWPFDAVNNIRIGITTSDMGVSSDGEPYVEPEPNAPQFDTPQVRCSGMGDNGEFHAGFNATEVVLHEGVIACTDGATQCPPGWTCENMDGNGVGTCMNPNGADAPVACPDSPGERSEQLVYEDRGDKALTAACLANVGQNGCNYEQQLMAGVAGLENNLDAFLRPRATTLIMVVSDEEDCSLKSDDWHELDELTTVTANLACGRHPEFLLDVEDIKERYLDAIHAVKGTPSGVIFAAIVGVPYNESGELSPCEGGGTKLGGCGDIKPAVNGTGTMAKPDEVGRVASSGVEQYYFEYACERYADDAGPDDRPVTAAYPGMRYVEMARLFGDFGFVYSICHEDWTPVMNELAAIVANLVGRRTCFENQLQWDAATETAACNMVFDYYFSKGEYPEAPRCPTDSGQQWENAGTVVEMSSQIGDVAVEYWKRSCPVKKLPSPIHCNDFSVDEKADYMSNAFGWFYCENRGEDNATACKDGMDNDRDGLSDGNDPDCAPCFTGTRACNNACPYDVRLTNAALSAASASEVKAVHVVCTEYTSALNNPDECYENSSATCRDGKDNDLDGAFDCWNYDKDDVGSIPDAHFPAAGARRADGGCCPMKVSTDGENRCEFLNAQGASVGQDLARASYIPFCSTGSSLAQIPDACCSAAMDLNCALPLAAAEECQLRGF